MQSILHVVVQGGVCGVLLFKGVDLGPSKRYPD